MTASHTRHDTTAVPRNCCEKTNSDIRDTSLSMLTDIRVYGVHTACLTALTKTSGCRGICTCHMRSSRAHDGPTTKKKRTEQQKRYREKNKKKPFVFS